MFPKFCCGEEMKEKDFIIKNEEKDVFFTHHIDKHFQCFKCGDYKTKLI
tara:strand:+ start:248 stop:394 length:147 start_codon:yes stop_codon:yes gene_type:complete